MARPIKKLVTRRRRNVVALLAVALLLLAADASGAAALHRTTLVSGWLLFALIIGLAMYNVRKKIPVNMYVILYCAIEYNTATKREGCLLSLLFRL